MQVPWPGVVLVITAQHAPQPFSSLRNRLVHLSAQLLLNLLQLLALSTAVRDAPDFETAQSVLRTDVPEAQKGERLRFPFPSLGPVLRRETPKPDQGCLLFVQLQTKPSQIYPELSPVSFCFRLVLKPEDGSAPQQSGPPDARRSALTPLPAALDNRTSVRLVASVSPTGHALRIPCRNFLGHGPTRMHENHAEVFLRPSLIFNATKLRRQRVSFLAP